MTVIRPNSISGVSSITGSGGDISIFRADGTAADVVVNNITSGVITATTFKGAVEGDVTGSGANLTSIPAGQLTGTVADARLSTVSSSKLSGALPALDGSALTGVGVGTADSINTSGIITATAFVSSQGALSNRNKIINGDFIIHQRGGTIASSSGNYTIDRWRTYRAGDSSGGWSVQQSLASYPQTNIAGVIDNFKASAFITVTSAGSAAANNNNKFQQRIEGSNVYDLAFGTVAAKKVTVSFYVKCSLTGDFGVALVNGDHNRSNVQLYTINSATTWERKILTFDGDTSGTWYTNSGIGLQLMFDIGSGSSKHASSTGTWLSGEYHGTTSSVKLVHTNGATIQFCGVQLEAGEIATPFEFRSHADELARCQRYYQVIADGNQEIISNIFIFQNNRITGCRPLATAMRTTPSVVDNTSGGTRFRINANSDQNTGNNITVNSTVSSPSALSIGIDSLASNMTNGAGGVVRKQGSSEQLGVQAEL